MPASQETDAYEWIPAQGCEALVLCCEHASERLPDPWTWPEADRRLVGTHWSHDLGAAELTRALARRLGCAAVLSRFTRLLVDPNRDLDQPGLFRELAEGQPVELNRSLSPEERARRLSRMYQPYHDAIDRAVAAAPGAGLLSMHSFTPVYEGQRREVEIGVLFSGRDDLAKALAERIGAAGWRVALNEPWSGADGFAFSPEHHATTHGRPWIELEVRQDLAVDTSRMPELVALLADASLELLGG